MISGHCTVKPGGGTKHGAGCSLLPLISGSLAFAVAIDRDHRYCGGDGTSAIGWCFRCLYPELIVKPEFRESGIGRKLLSALVSRSQSRGITWIALIAEPGTEQFYIPSGFKRMEGYVPMILKGPEKGEKSNVIKT